MTVVGMVVVEGGVEEEVEGAQSQAPAFVDDCTNSAAALENNRP